MAHFDDIETNIYVHQNGLKVVRVPANIATAVPLCMRQINGVNNIPYQFSLAKNAGFVVDVTYNTHALTGGGGSRNNGDSV